MSYIPIVNMAFLTRWVKVSTGLFFLELQEWATAGRRESSSISQGQEKKEFPQVLSPS